MMVKLARLSIVLAAVAWAPWAQAQDAAGDAANGKQLYMKDGCFSCHGTVGQGGGGRAGGLRLAQMAMPFTAFLDQLRHPSNEMPPYVAAVLSDRDASDIYAYIANLPPPPDIKTIPALNN